MVSLRVGHPTAVSLRNKARCAEAEVPRCRTVPRCLKVPCVRLHERIWDREGALIRYPDRGLDVITLTHIDGRRGVLSTRCEKEQTNDSVSHLMLLRLAASRMITSKAAEEVSPRERAIFASNDLATSVRRKFDCVFMYRERIADCLEVKEQQSSSGVEG